MGLDSNFDPIEGARIERVKNPMDGGSPADPAVELRNHLYGESRGILVQVVDLIGKARAASDRGGTLEGLTEAQDGLIHAIIDVHTLIHLELGKAQS